MTGAELAPLELAGRLALALSLAVFLGLAFEEAYKRKEREIPGGIRTFPMLTMSGAMLYLIEPQFALAFIVGLFALAIWLHAHLHTAPPGGSAAHMIPPSNRRAAAAGLTRPNATKLIALVPEEELLIAGKFLVLIGIILPIVPNQPVTVATPLTPYHVWLAVVAVCTLSYLSYLLQKYVPAPNTTLLPAVLGGIYSSTATTGVLAKRQREANVVRSDLAAGIVAGSRR